MKVTPPSARAARTGRHSSLKERGSAVIAVLALLSVMLVLVGINARVLSQLKQEIRLLDQRQQQRFEPKENATRPATNALPAAAAAPAK